MTILPHAIIGAVVGSYTNSIPVAVIAGVASHFILDSIPHYDHPIAKDNLKSVPAIFWWGSNIFALGVLWFFYNSLRLTIFVGALSAALVDVENLVCMISGYGLAIHRVGRWHRKTSALKGMFSEMVVLAVGGVWLYFRLGR